MLPCADCAGIVHTLNLRPDGAYFLRRTYLGKPGDPVAQSGGWSFDDKTSRLRLRHGGERQYFALDAGTLVKLDNQPQAILSAANLALRRTSQLDPVADVVAWQGQFTYMADAANFVSCVTPNLRWPVAMQADYLALERSYTQATSQPGAPMLVRFEGHLAMLPAMEGPAREHMVIDRWLALQPGAVCPTSPGLRGTQWQLQELAGRQIKTGARGQSINFTLAMGADRVSGFSGCNRLMGGFSSADDRLTFTQMAGSMMACQAEDMALEREFLSMLPATTRFLLDDQSLTLFKKNDVLARFVAVVVKGASLGRPVQAATSWRWHRLRNHKRRSQPIKGKRPSIRQVRPSARFSWVTPGGWNFLECTWIANGVDADPGRGWAGFGRGRTCCRSIECPDEQTE